MRIIYARMAGYNFVSTPSDAVVRELENLGHTIFWTDNLSYLPTDKYDFVFSPYESATILGDAISKVLGIPHYAHIEWLPPWRILPVNPKDYGISKDSKELNNEQLISNYKKIGKAWLEAELKTISCRTFIPYHEKFLQTDLANVLARYPSIDYRGLSIAKKMFTPKKIPNMIITVSRLVENKRYDLMCKVMNRIKTKVIWNIVGDGPLKDFIKKEITNPNVTLVFSGALWGWERIYKQMQASVMLGSWTGMPPFECAILGAYPVVVAPPMTDEFAKGIHPLGEQFGNAIFMRPEEDAEYLAEYIDATLAKPEDIPGYCMEITEELLAGKCGITMTETNAKIIIDKMETYLKYI